MSQPFSVGVLNRLAAPAARWLCRTLAVRPFSQVRRRPRPGRSRSTFSKKGVRMFPRKIITVMIVLSVFALAAWAQTSPPRTQIPAPTSSSPPQFSPGPLTDYNAALPNSTDVLRFRRGERYNSPNSPLPELGEESDATLVSEQMGDYYRDPMPFSQSDAVVVGTVRDGQTHLSNDKRDIYTEFNITVQEVVKTPSVPYLRAG